MILIADCRFDRYETQSVLGSGENRVRELINLACCSLKSIPLVRLRCLDADKTKLLLNSLYS